MQGSLAYFFSNLSEILDKVRTRSDKNVPSGGTHPSEGANAPGSDASSFALSTGLCSFVSRQAGGSVDHAHSNRQEGSVTRTPMRGLKPTHDQHTGEGHGRKRFEGFRLAGPSHILSAPMLGIF
jgi:hypothetical protein